MVSTQHSALSTQHSALSTQPASVLARRNWFFNIIGVLVGLLLTLNSVAKECTPASYGVTSNSDHLNICAGIESTTNGGHSDVATACHKNIDAYYSIFDNICPHTYCNNLYDKHILRKDGGLVVQTWGGAFWRYAQWYVVTYHSRYTPGVWTAEHRFPASVTIFGQDEQCSDTPPPASTLLTLTPAPNQKDPRPLKAEGKDGKSTFDLIAKVTENGSPKAGVAVTFKVDVDYASGGHASHSGIRPKGSVPPSGNTDDSGEVKLQFQAGEFSGTEKITATCDTCSNKTATHDVTVKVPDLISLQADSSSPPRYELAGNTSPVGVKHKGNHYFTASARINLLKLIDYYNSFAWQPVAVNDASIIWGGWFDIYSNWSGSHAEHRIGEEVDLGFLVGTNASKIKRGYDEVCKDKKVEIPSTILWHDIPKPAGKYDPHFHVRLSGSYTKGPSAGKYAPCKSDSGTK